MTPRRIAAAACVLMVAATSSGCRSNGLGLSRPAPIAAPVPELEPTLLVEKHNQNARMITSYQASPSVTPRNKSGRKSMIMGVASGKLYIEPPRNFRLVMSAAYQDVVDVGSNDDQLWIWSKELAKDTVYTCNYDEAGGVPVSGLYQPDWIMEALGLEALPEPGSEGVSVRKDKNGTDVVLEQKRVGADGKVGLKETVFSGIDGKIVEHRLFQLDAAGQKSLVANAKVTKYEKFEVKSTEADSETATVELPKVVDIHWPAEQVDLEVQLSNVKLNSGFSSDAAKLFSVPTGRGTTSDLREQLGLAVDSSSPATRETRPAPPSGGVKLSEPIPAASRSKPNSKTNRPGATSETAVATAVARPTPVSEAIVKAGLPPEPEPQAIQVLGGWRAGDGLPIRR